MIETDEAVMRALAFFERRADVRLVYLFGSRAHGEARPDSDVDLAVLLDRRGDPRGEAALRAELSGVLPEADLVLLDGAGPALLFEVVDGGRCVLARDPREQAEFEILARSRFCDFAPVRRIQDQLRRERREARRARSS